MKHPMTQPMTQAVKQRGFTLIETMIATVIMAGALIVIGSSWSGNYMRIEKARVNANMASLLERKMTEIDLEYRDKPITEIKEEDAGEFAEEFKQFRWEMRSKEFEMPDMTSMTKPDSSSSGKNDEIMAMIIKTVAEYVKTAVKEVTVTVYYRKNPKTKEISQAIVTYFVDYTKPLSISGLPGAAAEAGAPAAGAPAAGAPAAGATGSN